MSQITKPKRTLVLVSVSLGTKKQLDALSAVTGDSLKNLMDEAVQEYIANRPATQKSINNFLTLKNKHAQSA